MLRIDKSEKKLVRLRRSTLSESDHWEREFQAMILANPSSFCEELSERLQIVGQEGQRELVQLVHDEGVGEATLERHQVIGGDGSGHGDLHGINVTSRHRRGIRRL